MSYCGECYYSGKKLKPCMNCYEGSEAKTEYTNADRIRSMTDEELAEFFEKLEVVCDMCAFKVGCCNIAPDNCKSGLLKWLQSEAEGVTENE